MESIIPFRKARVSDTNAQYQQSLTRAIRQLSGESITFENAPLAVMTPIALQGMVNGESFRGATERYFRWLVGSQGNTINIAGDLRDSMLLDIEITMNGMAIVAPVEGGPLGSVW